MVRCFIKHNLMVKKFIFLVILFNIFIYRSQQLVALHQKSNKFSKNIALIKKITMSANITSFVM